MTRQAPWFRVKACGYGAGLPCRWQGWAALAIYVAALAAIIVAGEPYTNTHPFPFTVAICIPTALLILVSWRKSDAPWRWRWGEKSGGGE